MKRAAIAGLRTRQSFKPCLKTFREDNTKWLVIVVIDMLRRRTLLLGAGALFAGGGAMLGTGAFTTVQAERTVEVETAGDSNALLTLDIISGSANSAEYAEITGNGLLEVTIPDVNLNAITHIDRVFQVTNNGTQPVVLYFEERPGSDNPDGNAIDVGARTDQLKADSIGPSDQPTGNGIVGDDIADLSAPSLPDTGAGYADLGVKIDVGETLEVGIYIDTSDDNLNDGLNESGSSDVNAGETLLENIVIYASAEAANAGENQFEANSSP